MKAVMCRSLGDPESLSVEEVPDPVADEAQVVIDVKACGVSFPDLLMVKGAYQLRPPLPFSPGGEVAGVISEVGEGVDDFNRGQRVMVMTLFGGFAERVVTSPDRVVKIPDSMGFEVAAGFLLNYGTSLHALRDRAELRAGETLLVLGAAGGVGLAAVEVGKQMGARVVAAASTEDKLALCREHGADETILYTTEDLKQRAKSLGGIDVVYDPVGGAHTDAALRALRPGGRHLVIGFASGEIPHLPLNLPLMKECSVVGVFWGNWAMREPAHHARNLGMLLEWFEAGHLRPHVSDKYPLDRAADALADIAERRAKGKVVLTV